MRRQNECALDPETLGLVANAGYRSEAEHHPVLQGIVDKCAQWCPVRHRFRVGICDAHSVLPCRILGNLELDLFGKRYRERQSQACTKQVTFCTKPGK